MKYNFITFIVINSMSSTSFGTCGLIPLRSKAASPYGHSKINLCTCPEKWRISNLTHHISCVRNPKCFFCSMDKKMCERLRVCQGSKFKPNQVRIDGKKRDCLQIKDEVLKYVGRFFPPISAKLNKLTDSEKRDFYNRKISDLKSQYDALLPIQNVSQSNIDAAETLLCRVRRVYLDIKNLIAGH
jgi:hypothetical protein